MSDKTILNQFGQVIVQNVRDEMIEWFDQTMAGMRRDIYSRYLSRHLQSLSPECQQAITELIPTIVDGTIAVFLQQFDLEARLRIEMQRSDGSFVDLHEMTDGLEAEYSFEEGWAATFSQQRPDKLRQEAEQAFRQGSQISGNRAPDA